MSISLSLVVCTRNRADRLPRCLAALAEIRSARSWEALFVDNGSTDETAHVLDDAVDGFPVPLRLVGERTAGVSRARNTGWQAARGEIVAYTDDDCYPAPDFVDALVDRFERDRELGFVGGAVLPYDPKDAPVTFVAVREPVEIPPRGFITPGLLISANLAFRRSVLEQIGGFDVAFGYGAGFAGRRVDAVIEDEDAVARAAASGWHGRYDPDVVVYHHHGRRPGPEIDRIRRGYGVGRGAFFVKCALDGRTRRRYLAGWLRLTVGRVRRRQELRAIGWELWGAAHYLAMRLRRRR